VSAGTNDVPERFRISDLKIWMKAENLIPNMENLVTEGMEIRRYRA